MSTVAQKLGITSGSTVGVAGQPIDVIRGLVGELPDDVVVAELGDGGADQVILAANGVSDLDVMLPGVWDSVSPGGRLWVWYRKGATKTAVQGSAVPLHRDTLQARLAKHGMDGVTLISVDDTWSAMRVKQL